MNKEYGILCNRSERGGADVLRPGDRVEVQLRVHYRNWRRCYQSNDCSFGAQSDYLDWRKMVVNCAGVPVWGEAPRQQVVGKAKLRLLFSSFAWNVRRMMEPGSVE
jgi:hypothetical protein